MDIIINGFLSVHGINKMDSSSIISVPRRKRIIPSQDWNNLTLRKCLSALGISKEEMRYTKGATNIVKFWKEDIEDLVTLAKVAWKKQVVLVHEANEGGGDPEQWKLLNTLYATILKKLAPYIREKRKRKNKILEFDCMICGITFKKKIVSWVQYKSALCDNHECKKEYYRRRSRKQREKTRRVREIFCENLKCRKRMVISNWKGRRRYCSKECRMNHWKEKNISKIKERQKIQQAKRPKWKDKWVTLTPEQQEEYRKNHSLRQQQRYENESPGKRAERLARNNKRMKEYRKRRAALGNPIKNPYIKREEWLAKKKEQYKDKPWIYETILQKYKRPDGTISSVALK